MKYEALSDHCKSNVTIHIIVSIFNIVTLNLLQDGLEVVAN